MGMFELLLIAGVIVVSLVAGMVCTLLFARFYVKVEQGKALIVNRRSVEPEVTFTGAAVWPVFNKAELMEISVKTIELDRRGKEGLICKDNIRADIRVTFFVRVNKDRNDVIKVAQSIGCARASDPRTLEELFMAKFSEALKTAGKQLDFVDLYTKRKEFRDQIVDLIGTDLNGFVLEDAAIDYLEQTPLVALDKDNILDAQGIRKITELTAIEHVRTNEYSNTERKQIKKQDVEANEAVLELDRQQADAEAKQSREIETMRAREQAETQRVQAEENQKIQNAQLRAEEQILIQQENRDREVQVAQKNRERVVAIETERVEKDRMVEAINREREVELLRIAKEKALEEERKLIQEVIRGRIIVEKGVAEEEERIKSLRVLEEARRLKDSTIIAAEAEAQELATKQIRAAEASEQAARLKSTEVQTMAEAEAAVATRRADAELTVATRQSEAKVRLAEGIQAEAAATGLAHARVKEADAAATEKLGMAQVRVKDAEAPANEKLGLADVAVERARVVVEAEAIQMKLSAESVGLTEKAHALAELEKAGRQHEEFRLNLENRRAIALESLHVQRDIAQSQAQVMAEAVKSAKINIVGGDGSFMDKMMGAITLGRSVDGFVDNSDTARTLLKDYISGEANLPQDLKDILSRPALSSGDLQNLTVAALLGRLMSGADGAQREKLGALLETVRTLGLDDVKLKA